MFCSVKWTNKQKKLRLKLKKEKYEKVFNRNRNGAFAQHEC